MKAPKLAKITKTCLHCGKPFDVHPRRAQTAKYCSRSCSAAHHVGEHGFHWQGGGAEKVCQRCGKTYSVYGRRAETSKYCSRECADRSKPKAENSKRWKGGTIGYVCPCCRKTFPVNRSVIPWPPEPIRMIASQAIRGYLRLEDRMYEKNIKREG